MKVSVLTVFPELYDPFLQTSLMRRAQENKLVQFDVVSFFSYVEPKQRIDAPTFGPGAGMLIKPEVVEKAIVDKEHKHGKAFKIFFSPQGEKVDQRQLEKLTKKIQEHGHVMLIPSRYEGMDVRVEQEYADELVSIGDFVLMGGDIPAMALLEGMLRLVPGVVGKQESVEEESFAGPFLDYPEYTEPVEWHGKKVPNIVRSGNHAAIDEWRKDQAARNTVKNHFNWMRSQKMSDQQKDLAKKYIPAHYVALMHTDVLIGDEQAKGTTSVTSIDIHDIARSSCTYDIKNFFIVTPLQDQKRIVQTLLDFWQKGPGIGYNKNRQHAVQSVMLQDSLGQAIESIVKKEGKQPILIATSARNYDHKKQLSFWDQSIAWKHDRPVLLIFGTGKGLAPEIIERCDYLLNPIHGFSNFKHLSVRSAIAVILDRWLGINEKDS